MPTAPRHAAPARLPRWVRTLAGVAGVAGEVLVTFAVIVLLYIAWELWWTNIDSNHQQQGLTRELVQEQPAADREPAAGPTSSASPTVPARTPDPSPTRSVAPPAGPEPTNPARAAAADRETYGKPPVARTGDDDAFGVLYIPRFGADYARPISQGVGLDVLNNVGIGHYPGTQSPGAAGNFAVAGHRQTHGQVFWDIDKLTDGDYLYLQTRNGYYTYRYRSTEIVEPEQNEVLDPVPHHPDQKAEESIMTMTSCHPPFTTEKRIIAYSQLESWRPAQAGPPGPIAETVDKAGRKQ